VVILPLIEDLERHGREKDAAWLRKEWEKKVKYFVYDDNYPYHSEYCTGSTAFCSSYDLAKYGVLHPMEPDTKLWYDKNLKQWWSHPEVEPEDSREFMDRQFQANLAQRGCVIPTYYYLGSSSRLYYTSRMGGRALFDYGLHFADEPQDWLQWGYSAYLNSFSLMNTGTAESNYGYWYPGKENDGATGWTFNAGKGSMRFRWGKYRNHPHGVQPYDGEADLGHGAVMRTAATVITNDPLFGWIAYGGNLQTENEKLTVIPEDGLGIRFGFVTENNRIVAELNRDRYSQKTPVVTDKEGKSIKLAVSNLTGEAHNIRLTLTGTEGAVYALKVNGKDLGNRELQGARKITAEFENPAEGCTVELVKMK